MTLSDDPPGRPGPVPADEALLAALRAGEARAVRTVEGWISGLLRADWRGIDEDARADLAQDALIALWREIRRADFELRASLRGLVRRIVIARCIDHLRRRRPVSLLDETIADPGDDPYARWLRADAGARVRWALRQLGERCRELLRARFYEERDYDSLARDQGASPGALRMQVFRCLDSLRSMLPSRA